MSDASTATETSSTLLGAEPAAAAPSAAPAPAATAPAADPAGAPAAAPAATPAPAAAPAAEVKAGDAKPAAPEKYEFTLPEGVEVDAAVMGEFEGVAKELGLPQDQAQKLIDLHSKLQTAGSEAQQAQITEFYSDIGGTPDKWGDAAKADKEFGGDKFDENLAVAKRALDQFGTPEFKKLLVKTGIGNHPEVLRAFVRAGHAISQDGFVPGRTANSPPDARNVYAKSNMNP